METKDIQLAPMFTMLEYDLESMLIEDFHFGADLSKKAMECGIAMHPIERERFLTVAPWLAVPLEICCFHVERATLPVLNTNHVYTGGLMFFCTDKVDGDDIRENSCFEGRITFLRDLFHTDERPN